MKELPKMYQTKITKKIQNEQQVYTSLNRSENKNVIKKELDQYQIRKKINDLFNSPDYIYKIDVQIITENETLNKRIIGRNRDNLITIDNEYIPINIIKDINKNS